MSQQMWFSRGDERVAEAFAAALSWCEGCWVASDAPSLGDALWSQLGPASERVRAAILANLTGASTDTLRPLYESNRVRRFVEGTQGVGHFAVFERGDELRFFLAPEALRSSSLAGPGIWLFWEGQRGGLPEGLQAIFDDCWASSVPATPEEFVSGPSSGVAAPYSRQILSVRAVLGIRTSRDYFELEPDDQEAALWSALIGEGAVDLEQAIRLCAERLRAQGFLDYQRLHQDGRVYKAIEERLLAARRRTDLFDRPRSGFVRAIQPDLEQLTAEQWRDCLMGALDEGAHVDRDEAVRLGFENAQVTYGINAQRLRGGGRADQALRSAINSAIRQGFLARDGAVYLRRVAASGEPMLRGVIGRDPVAENASDNVADAPASVAAAVPGESATPSAALDLPQPLPVSKPAPVLTAEPVAPLDRDLQTLPLPTRTLNWAARHEVAIVRQLVAWHPEAFEQEKNVGRSTVRETREVLESLLGHSWEDAYIAVHGGAPAALTQPSEASTAEDDSANDALTATGATGWAALAARLTPEEQDVSLVDIQLPTRMKNFVRSEGLERLGDLFKLSHASLTATANLGRKSLNDTVDAVRDFLSERVSPPVYATFLQAWQAQLAALEPIPRMIVTRRAGMHGERETLEELGAMLGVTRERVRQIEGRVLERLAERSRWRRSVEANLVAAFGSGRALPLDLLAQDSWWAGIDQQELLLDYVVRRIFEDQLFVLEAPSGKRYLTKFGPSDFIARLESAKSRVAKLEYPLEMSVLDEILRSEADALDPILFTELQLAVGELLLRDPANPSIALGYGRYRSDDVLAFLNGQPEPVRIEVLEEHCGRGALPDEVLHFKRGVVGLKRHFPDFDEWTAKLVPAALEVMQERPPGRQWLVPEIHDALRERGLLPEWLGHWHLASVLRLSGQVDYLGRLRVALKEGAQEERLQYVGLLQQVLVDAGAPLPFDELLARARIQSDIPEASASLRVLAPPFIRIDDSRIGLVERDIPGGPQAVAAAIEAVVRTLNDTELGLTPHQATQVVSSLSDVHAQWSRQLVISVLRNESTIRIDRTKNIGLDEWDDVRCPTRAEFMRRAVQQAGGKLALASLYASMDAFYGRAPDRGSLGVMAQQVGLSIVGDHIVRAATATIEPAVERVGINLTGIPAVLREKFQEYVDLPMQDVLTLRKEVKKHVDEMAQHYLVNEFVDLEGAHQLAGQCHLLLDRWENLPIADRHLAHAAVHYFTSWDDVENDLDIGGLDDDKQIMNAVLGYLGIHESSDGAPAS